MTTKLSMAYGAPSTVRDTKFVKFGGKENVWKSATRPLPSILPSVTNVTETVVESDRTPVKEIAFGKWKRVEYSERSTARTLKWLPLMFVTDKGDGRGPFKNAMNAVPLSGSTEKIPLLRWFNLSGAVKRKPASVHCGMMRPGSGGGGPGSKRIVVALRPEFTNRNENQSKPKQVFIVGVCEVLAAYPIPI
jgi:hypothetical protein